MAATASASMALIRLVPGARTSGCSALPLLPPRLSLSFPASVKVAPAQLQRFQKIQTRVSSEEPAVELFSDLKEKWDAVENKSTLLLYGGGAIVAVWLASIVVSAINSVPLLPKIMELVGLGYTGWFVYRYLLFKSSRKELATDIDALKKKIDGTE